MMQNISSYSDGHLAFMADSESICFDPVFPIAKCCLEFGVSVVSFFLYPAVIDDKDFQENMDSLARFVIGIREWGSAYRVIPLGGWYDLPSRVIDSIKSIVSETADNEGIIVNLCINYDGRREIVDACRVVGHQIKNNKIDPESITSELIKECMYSSKTRSVDVVFTYDRFGILLWDCADARIVRMKWCLGCEGFVRNFLSLTKA